MSEYREEAAKWFATLRRGVMTVEEQASFKAWSRNHYNATALAELQALWGELEMARDHVAPQSAAAKTAAAYRLRRSRFSHALQAAAVVGAVMLGVGIMYSTDTTNWTELDWSDR